MIPRRLMLVVLGAAIGCGGGSDLKPLDELKSELHGKTTEEVLSLMGKPARVIDSSSHELWVYRNAARHSATGKIMSVILKLRGGRVVEVDGS